MSTVVHRNLLSPPQTGTTRTARTDPASSVTTPGSTDRDPLFVRLGRLESGDPARARSAPRRSNAIYRWRSTSRGDSSAVASR